MNAMQKAIQSNLRAIRRSMVDFRIRGNEIECTDVCMLGSEYPSWVFCFEEAEFFAWMRSESEGPQ